MAFTDTDIDLAVPVNGAPSRRRLNAVLKSIRSSLSFNVKEYGAVGDGVTDDTKAIQSTIEAASDAGGGVAYFPAGTYKISGQGIIHQGTRDYCLLLRPKVFMRGEAPGIVKLQYTGSNVQTDLIATPSTGDIDTGLTQTAVGIENIIVDGGSTGGVSGGGFNIWIKFVKGVRLSNVESLNSTSWGIRIQECEDVFLENINADHPADVNADGVHFVDCRDVVCNNIIIDTEGDDAFIIETLAHEVRNYDISGLIVRAPTAGIAAGRGILLLHEPLISTAARKMENINIQAVAKDCYGPALVTSGQLLLTASHFSVTSINCRNGLYLVAGASGSDVGVISGNQFNITAINPTEQGVFCIQGSGATIADNRIEAFVSNPADTFTGAKMEGSGWTGSIVVDYDPNSDKVSPGIGIDIRSPNSTLFLDARGANKNIVVSPVATNNLLHLGHLRDAVTADIEIALGNSAPPKFFGGKVTGTITNESQGKFISVDGASSVDIAEMGALIGFDYQQTGVRQLYVATTGSDNNPGTAALPFATIGAAINAAKKLNPAGFNLFIEVADGTYNETGLTLPYIPGQGQLYLRGNEATPANVVITASSGDAITIEGERWFIRGIKVNASAGRGFSKNTYGVTRIDNVAIGTVSSDIFYGTGLTVGGTVTVDGGTYQSLFHVPIAGGGSQMLAAVNFLATTTFTAYVFGVGGGFLDIRSFTHSGSAVTGRKFLVQAGGSLRAEGLEIADLPGTANSYDVRWGGVCNIDDLSYPDEYISLAGTRAVNAGGTIEEPVPMTGSAAFPITAARLINDTGNVLCAFSIPVPQHWKGAPLKGFQLRYAQEGTNSGDFVVICNACQDTGAALAVQLGPVGGLTVLPSPAAADKTLSATVLFTSEGAQTVARDGHWVGRVLRSPTNPSDTNTGALLLLAVRPIWGQSS